MHEGQGKLCELRHNMNYGAPEVTVGSEGAVEHTLGGCIRRPVTADSSLPRAARSLPLCLLVSPEAKPFPYSSRSCTHQAVELGASLSCDSRPVRITPQTEGTERMGVIFTSQASDTPVLPLHVPTSPLIKRKKKIRRENLKTSRIY